MRVHLEGRRPGRALLGTVLVLVGATGAWADTDHYVNFLVGDRAAGMGGAYTAVADDPSGLYYNPAGAVYAGSTGLSASMNAYRTTKTTYEGAIGGKDWERTSSELVPNFFGIVQPAGSVYLGFSYAVPDSINTDQDQEFGRLAPPFDTVASYRINFNEFGTTYNFGPTLAGRLGERLSLGLTLYGHYRSFDRVLSILAGRDDGETFWSSDRVDTDEWGIRPLLGFMLEVSDRVSFGITLSRTFVLTSDSRVQNTTKEYGSADMITTVDDVSERKEYPYRFSLGAAWFASSSFLLSGDFSYHTGTEDEAFGDREPTWNVALGTEYYLNRNWALRAGYFTDRANTSDVSGTGVQNDHVDLHGVSFSISHHRRGTSLSLGAVYQGGVGETQLLPNSTDAQEATSEALTIYISASYQN